mmetsp:Transcript_15125/g.27930  ORF Transcript_15125/g.27930 Transcript_15125/m.27930 type:complete len:445 (+) Transcript_15125:145-1479(+)
MHTSLSTNTTLLRTAVVVLLGRERESVVTPFIGNHQVRSLQASSDDISAAYLGEFRNSIFFAAQSFPEHGINACWDESCDHTSAASTCRIEAAFACSLRYFPPQTGVDWFVFTTGSVFWNTEGLIAEVERAEQLLLPGDPSRDILLVGGGGLLIFDEFMILSRPAVNFLASIVEDYTVKRGRLDSQEMIAAEAALALTKRFAFAPFGSCKAALGACNDQGSHVSTNRQSPSSATPQLCPFKLDPRRPRDGFPYTANELVHFCLAGPLAQGDCGGGSTGGGGGGKGGGAAREAVGNTFKALKRRPRQQSDHLVKTKPRGCAWVFGRLAQSKTGSLSSSNSDGGGAQSARRRFVSNAAHRRPTGAISELLKADRIERGSDDSLGARAHGGDDSDDPEKASACRLAQAMHNFAAFGNAQIEDFRYLSAVRDRARTAKNCSWLSARVN